MPAGKIMRNAKKSELYVKIIAVSVFSVLLFFVLTDVYRFRMCFKAAKRIPPFSQAEFCRFLIHGSGTDTVSAVFRLYDSGGKELAVIERSWKGESLRVDFVGASFGGKTLYFPRCIYGFAANAPVSSSCRSGTDLSHYYIQEERCLLYDAEGCEKDFFRLARYALHLDIFGLSRRFSAAPHIKYRTLSLGACKPGKNYSIKTDSSGSLEVLPE